MMEKPGEMKLNAGIYQIAQLSTAETETQNRIDFSFLAGGIKMARNIP